MSGWGAAARAGRDLAECTVPVAEVWQQPHATLYCTRVRTKYGLAAMKWY